MNSNGKSRFTWAPGPEILRNRINERIDVMMENGLEDEVRRLLEAYPSEPTAFDAIGYREIIACIKGACTRDEAIAAMKMNTWHYAKLQVTWFKKDREIQWIADPKEAISAIEGFLK